MRTVVLLISPALSKLNASEYLNLMTRLNNALGVCALTLVFTCALGWRGDGKGLVRIFMDAKQVGAAQLDGTGSAVAELECAPGTHTLTLNFEHSENLELYSLTLHA